MLNTVVIIGRLTRDPELRYNSKGTAVTGFGIAVDRGKKDAQGKSIADFFNVYCYARLAEIVAQYLVKGRLVAVQGRLQSRTKERDGQRIAYVSIIAHTVRFLEKPPKEQQPPQQSNNKGNSYQQGNYGQGFNIEEDDDLPF